MGVGVLGSFFDLSRTEVEQLASSNGIKLSKDLTDFEYFYDLIKLTLKKSDQKTLEILSHRLQLKGVDEHFSKQLEHIDDAVDVLDETYVNVAEHEKETLLKRKGTQRLFAKSFGDKRRELETKDPVCAWLNHFNQELISSN